MDAIELKIIEDKQNEDYCEIYINGKNFIEIVKEAEAPFFCEIAGAYSFASVIKTYWFLDSFYDNPNSFNCILICECGEIMCWDLNAKREKTKDTIIWRDFAHNSSKVKCDYNLYFEFERKNYYEELNKLLKHLHGEIYENY